MNYNTCPFKNEFNSKLWRDIPKERIWKAYLYFLMQRDYDELQKKADKLFLKSKDHYHWIKKKMYYDKGKYYRSIILKYKKEDAIKYITEIEKSFEIDKEYFDKKIHCARLEYDIDYIGAIKNKAIAEGMYAHAHGKKIHISNWPPRAKGMPNGDTI